MGSGTSAWYGLGNVVEGTLSSKEALEQSGLIWNVNQEKVFVLNKEVEGVFANVRSDTSRVLGLVTKKYKIVQNVDAFSFVDDIVSQEDTPCRYESAGSLLNGTRVWLLAQLPKRKILDDDVANYLCFTNSHDGKSSLKVAITLVRVVCQNTLNMALAGAKRTWSMRHMGSIEGKQREAIQTLNLASSYLDKFQLEAEKMVSIRADINDFLDKMFPLKEDISPRIKRNIETTRDEILSIYGNKDDLGNFRGTAWGVLNSFADWASNAEPLRKSKTLAEKKFMSFIDGSRMMEKAQAILV